MKTKNTLFSVILLITFCIPQIGNTQTSTISSEVYLDLETGDTYVDDFAKGIQVESRFDLRLTWYNNVIVWIPNWNATDLSAAYVLDTSYSEISYNTIDSQTFCTNYGCDNEYLDPLSPNNGIGVSLIINTSEGNYYKIKYQNYDSENYTVTLNYEFMEEVALPSPFSFNSNETGIQSLNNTASGDTATALGKETIASGQYATTMGQQTTASANAATAMGVATISSGDGSTSIGGYTTAGGIYSFASGDSSKALGNYSSSFGIHTNANGWGTTAIGIYNRINENNINYDFSLNNTAFVIGNGWLNENNEIVRSNALEVLFDGTTTIAGNVTAPAFIGDGSQLTNLPTSTVNYSDLDDKPFSFGTDENNPGIQATSTTANGARAFAVGSGTQASGSNAFASGDRTKATNSYTTAMGYKSEASNFASTALGKETIASGQYATAMGQQTTASQNASTAMGDGSFASGNAATAMGSFTEAIGIASTAMGQQTKASGLRATAMGLLTEASGVQSTATGFNTIANANQSTAMGVATTAEDFASVSIGQFNKTDETPNPSAFSLQNTAFVIGNGEDTNSRSNALEVLFDGTTTIAGDLNINSDARLKANIISLGATLSKLLQIDGKTYTMKKDTKNKPKIGLLAQEIETVFPELVSETNNIKSVNYQGLVPVLINAIKEQQQEIERLKKQEERLRLLEQKVNTLLNK